MRRLRILAPLALLLLPGCRQPAEQEPAEEGAVMNVNSSAFSDGAAVPKEYTGDGRNTSPPLQWGDAPAGTQSFAVILDDPDAPRGLFTHWVLFNLPADRHELPAAVPTDREVLGGARQGINGFGDVGYGGPAPPKGKPHRYFFHVYALDRKLDLEAGCKRSDLDAAMKGHILASGKTMGTYGR
jgi:Raf kinase inhibitor-like YbhB/YbcL family protein